jgi:hypothetical protein
MFALANGNLSRKAAGILKCLLLGDLIENDRRTKDRPRESGKTNVQSPHGGSNHHRRPEIILYECA